MKKVRQFATVAFLCVIILLVGLLARNYLENKNAAKINAINTPLKQDSTAHEDLKKADYIAALPHFGPLIHTENIVVTYKDGQAIGTINNIEETKILPKQNVILFNQNNEILPLGGKVVKIEGNQVFITLPEETETNLLTTNLQVITMETVGSKRVPLSAFQQNEEGKNFVWVAEPPEDGTSKRAVRKNIVTSTLQDKNYLDAGLSLYAMDWVILNPDDNLREDKKYNIAETKLNAPLHDPIRQAWGEFELRRLATAQEDMLQRYINCKNGTPNNDEEVSQGSASLPDGGTASSCGASQEILNDPVAIFNSLISNLENGGTASGASACGATANACGQ